MLAHPELTGCYNAGFENISAMDTARLIAEHVQAKVMITAVKDKRSYAVDSSKLLAAGFWPKHTVSDAIRDIVDAYCAGKLKPEPQMINLAWMRSRGLLAA
jgi:DNA-binding NarL/FixJ family response regulator